MISKKLIFKGSATALVTPFKNGKIDFVAFERLIDFQLSNLTSAIVVLGTTGESPTIRDDERTEILKFAKDKIAGKVPLIAGTGSNSTHHAIKLTENAEKIGADACLSVTPYYNKATTQGLKIHYKEIAKSTSLPIIMYNVPSRTGMNLSCETLYELTDVKNIVAIKEASGNVSEIEQKIAKFKDYFWFYSGCDELILPIYSLGGVGVISAVSNVFPSEISTLCSLFEKKCLSEAQNLAINLSPAIKELFAEVNPIPVKATLSLMGLCENELRLPLCPSTRGDKIKENVLSVLKKG